MHTVRELLQFPEERICGFCSDFDGLGILTRGPQTFNPEPWPLTGYKSMKQLTIVVRPITAEAVLKVIGELDVNVCLVQEAKGYSRQKGYLERYRGSEYSMAFLPKVEINVWVSDQRLAEVEDRITKVARTGRIGDGKVFVIDVGWPGAMEF